MGTVTYRPFFAILPPPDVADHIYALGAQYGLPGHRVSPDRLHLTTYPFERFAAPPDASIADMQRVVDGLSLPGFHVVFDRLVGDDKGARLLPSQQLAGLEPAAKTLRNALLAAGLPPIEGWRFHPHMSLLYGRGPTLDLWLDGGIRWRAEHLTLILSEVGAQRHRRIAQWVLG